MRYGKKYINAAQPLQSQSLVSAFLFTAEVIHCPYFLNVKFRDPCQSFVVEQVGFNLTGSITRKMHFL